MRISFIASEYNPFHNGHKYHIDRTKEAGADAVVCVMSGNFVQRGEAAVAHKHHRAEAAILGGADLVLELPLKYAVSTASFFAKGFIDTVCASGLSGTVSFGAATDIDKLKEVKDIIFSEDCENYCSQKLKSGISFPVAKTQYLCEKLNYSQDDILNDSNNILALEYLNAIDNCPNNFDVLGVKRFGVKHDADYYVDEFASASYIRELIYSGNFSEVIKFMPANLHKFYSELYKNYCFPSDKEKFETMAISRLISLDADYIKELNNVTGGIENRITEAIREYNKLEDIYSHVKSKHFTHSRVRQILLNAVLGIKKSDLESGLSYIRVLAFNNRGREVLNLMKHTSTVPVITNLSQIRSYDRNVELDYTAGKLYNLCLPQANILNPEYRIAPRFVDNL